MGVVGEPCRGGHIKLVQHEKGVEVSQREAADAPANQRALSLGLLSRQDNLQPRKKKKKASVSATKKRRQRKWPRGQSTRIHVPEAAQAFLSCEVHASQVRALKARAVLVSGASRYGSIRQRWYPTGALQSLSYICTRRSYTAV